ncbi:DinB family protein [Glaciihabitans sp. INWT7]|uniref:DinB family protein n=1 Tax=Glaciihabitans sp. INWT7 TaxID=2596912 RepID=UPI00162AB554|nr:DinB family protein [Glaciihabitans sp. INWT7]QNE48221.1 DinB family protein [Glaciihabitans sp. INWT7]
MPIMPDTKNWTWVLDRPCPECGFDATTVAARDVAALVRANAAAWPPVLQRADVAQRPDGSTWSALEYAAHVRDVYRIFLVRLGLMLDEYDPVFPNWDQDETATAEHYNEQDPAAVADELVGAGAALAAAFDAVPDDSWGRPGRRNDGAQFTVASFAVYLAHDPTHHLWDVRAPASDTRA